MKFPERATQAIVEALIPSARMEFRESQADGEYDFDLYLASGERVALEVTASADSAYIRTLAVLGDQRKGGQFVACTRCRYGWWIHPEFGARIDRIRGGADEYLSVIEESGVTEFFAPIHAAENEAVRRIWQDLRVESGSVFSWKSPTIGIAAPGRATLIDPTNIVLAFEAEAQKADNIAKLERAGTHECHLVVFIDPSNNHAWSAMIDGVVPSRAPTFPDVITHAWLISSVGSLNRFRALLFQRDLGWTDFGFVQTAVQQDS